MEKLTQFVSKSFENNNNNNNNRTNYQQLLKSDSKNSVMSEEDTKISSDNSTNINDDVKEEKVKTDIPVAKNWLISTSPKPQNNQQYGIDLRVSTNGYTIYSTSQTTSSDIKKYSELTSSEKNLLNISNTKDTIKWFDNIGKTNNSKLCCCPTTQSKQIQEQDDSTDSNLDNMANQTKQPTTQIFNDDNKTNASKDFHILCMK